jgi:microsomal dipeptidase-like Zn-dependent dipeptidase
MLACMQGVPEVSIERRCDHIDDVVALTGPEHVDLGFDWDGANVVVKGLERRNCLMPDHLIQYRMDAAYADKLDGKIRWTSGNAK